MITFFVIQYYGGKLVDLPLEADGLSSIGVYPGQGAACKLVKSPCNQGFCIEEYNKYQCNCSISAFSGIHCQLGKCWTMKLSYITLIVTMKTVKVS